MVKAILLTVPRSGSEVLVECLDSHPDIKCESEILLPYMCNLDLAAIKLKEFFETQEKDNSSRITPRKIIGFKAMYMHLSEECWRYIRKNNVQIIHLIRNNQFERAVSDEFNHRKDETGRNHHSKKDEQFVSLEVNRKKLFAAISEYNQMVKDMVLKLKRDKVPHITINYEDLFQYRLFNKTRIDTLPKGITKKFVNF